MLLAARICLWHALVILRSALFHSTSFHAFCHPVQVETEGMRLNICPFARRFANPGLFAVLCAHCRPGERTNLVSSPVCRRRGGGPPSKITHVILAVVPLIVAAVAFHWLLLPVPTMVRHAQRLFIGAPTPDAASRGKEDSRTEAIGPMPVAPVPTAPGPGTPSLPPQLQPRWSDSTAVVPPPPLGLNPRERRMAVRTRNRPRPTQDLPSGLLTTFERAKQSGNYVAALAAAKVYSKSAPDHVGGLVLLARAALECREPVLAESAARRILSLKPRTAEAWAILGRLHAEQGDTAQAEQEYRKALALDPDCELASAGLALIPASSPRED